ncbi:hypothetical protein ACE102_25410 [Bradyrhizobium sp. vgs-9]|uniref:hypothetical protein n=1 Tax=Bradyrhizobium sp. vgs-9 TaxID=208389 RepID=UPI0035D4984F
MMLRKLSETARERARRVIGARLVWADQEYFRDLADCLDGDELDELLVSRFALMSEAQVPPNEVNLEFDVAPDVFAVERPAGYGRVLVVQTEWGPFDVKGAGVANHLRPLPTQHANGLLTFPAAIAEICMEQVARRALAEQGIETARCVALLLLPVYLRDPLNPSGQVRCALLVRESFPRVYANPEDVGSALAMLEFSVSCERALRRAGLTTTSSCTNMSFVLGPSGDTVYIDSVPAPAVIAVALADLRSTCPFIAYGEIDTLNVQLCLDLPRQKLRLVDFGSAEFRPAFDKPLLAACLSRLPEAANEMVQGPSPHQRIARASGFACAVSAHPAFNPPQVHHPRAPLLEMVPLRDDGPVERTPNKTKRLAKMVLAQLAQAKSDVELCAWACSTINEFASAGRHTQCVGLIGEQ